MAKVVLSYKVAVQLKVSYVSCVIGTVHTCLLVRGAGTLVAFHAFFHHFKEDSAIFF